MRQNIKLPHRLIVNPIATFHTRHTLSEFIYKIILPTIYVSCAMFLTSLLYLSGILPKNK